MSSLRVIKKVVLSPLLLLHWPILSWYKHYLQQNDLKRLANILHIERLHSPIHWDNPRLMSEKINWLKFNTDTTQWTRLADKYEVRGFVQQQGLGDILPELYGVWNDANEIDFDTLPNAFVLKTNHGCGTIVVVKDKATLNIPATRQQLNAWLSVAYGRKTAEPHYLPIKPKVIAEQLLQPSNGELVDYKLYMVDGKMEFALVCYDRKFGKGCRSSLYDENWQCVNHWMTKHKQRKGGALLSKPASFEQMKQAAQRLSQGFPQVRVDFYDVDGKLYFGEMTFTWKGGYVNNLVPEQLLRIGEHIHLPKQ